MESNSLIACPWLCKPCVQWAEGMSRTDIKRYLIPFFVGSVNTSPNAVAPVTWGVILSTSNLSPLRKSFFAYL